MITEKQCRLCGCTKPVSMFPFAYKQRTNPTMPGHWRGVCFQCFRKTRQAQRYGISLGTYEQLYAQQAGKCCVCRRDLSDRSAVDHDHKTGKVRGILCVACNGGIGLLGDDPVLVARAAVYLLERGAA